MPSKTSTQAKKGKAYYYYAGKEKKAGKLKTRAKTKTKAKKPRKSEKTRKK